MGLDYYWILSLKNDCTYTEINNAYRALAVSLLDNNEGEDLTDHPKHSLVGEAYDVLSSPLSRTIYDHIGEEGLKAGLLAPPYVYHGDPLKTASNFFGSLNNLTAISKYYKQPLPILNCLYGQGTKEKSSPITYDLLLTLEEVFFGGKKIIRIQRLDYSEVNNGFRLCEKNLNIPIARGIKPNTKIVFKEAGDRKPTCIPADIIVIVKQREHNIFVRSGSNLILEKEKPLQEVLSGCILTVTTLDSRKIHLQMNAGMGPFITKVVEGEGLPIPGSQSKAKGDLIVRIKVVYPSNLPRFIRDQLQNAFKPLSEMKEKKVTFYDEKYENII